MPSFANTVVYRRSGIVLASLTLIVSLYACLRAISGQDERIQSTTTEMKTSMAGNDLDVPPHFFEALDNFTQIIHDNAEEKGLGPFLWQKSTGASSSPSLTRQFDGFSFGLLQQAFGGRRVALVGDSTLFYLLKWFKALESRIPVAQQDSFVHMNLSQATKLVNPNGDKFMGFPGMSDMKVTGSNYNMTWDGYAGQSGNTAVCNFTDVWTRTREMKPDVMVVNFGFHWLHLEGGGRDVPLCFVQKWLGYEDWLETAVQVALESKTKLLFLKTTNFICQDKYDGPYARSVERYQEVRQQRMTDETPAMDSNRRILKGLTRLSGRNHSSWTRTNNVTRIVPKHHHNPLNAQNIKRSLFDICAQQIQKKVKGATNVEISEEDVTRYCEEATFDLVGAQHLNQRMRDFLAKKQPLLQNSGLKIVLYNDHDLESCMHTGASDGRHFHPLNLVRIRLLANMIQALY